MSRVDLSGARTSAACRTRAVGREKEAASLSDTHLESALVPTSRRQEALLLADELLRNIELSELPAPEVARKAYRLARLVDDADAVTWLAYEVGGYPDAGLDADSWAAAMRSNRGVTNADGEPAALTQSAELETLQGEGSVPLMVDNRAKQSSTS